MWPHTVTEFLAIQRSCRHSVQAAYHQTAISKLTSPLTSILIRNMFYFMYAKRYYDFYCSSSRVHKGYWYRSVFGFGPEGSHKLCLPNRLGPGLEHRTVHGQRKNEA